MSGTEPWAYRLGDLTALVGEAERGSRQPHEILLIDVVHGWICTLDSEGWGDLDVAGFFFALASRLVVLKLRLLLPSLDDEGPLMTVPVDPGIIGGLGDRLAMLEARQQDFALCTLEHDPSTRRVLAEADSLSALLKAAGEIIRSLTATGLQPVVGEFMSPEEARARVSALLARGSCSLADLLGSAHGLLELLSYFLALLEIVRLGWYRIRVESHTVWIDPGAAVRGEA
ncbi:hypothetical protein JXA88_11280 [Candidatus Fermentibacteria bacterium]|nr:hypothetical protein [Candidatus Fermentibacteria bacterium]